MGLIFSCEMVNQSFLLEFNRISTEIFVDHKSNFENDSMVKFSQIKSGKFLDFIQTINQGVTVNEQLTGCLGNVKIVIKESLNGKEGFLV